MKTPAQCWPSKILWILGAAGLFIFDVAVPHHLLAKDKAVLILHASRPDACEETVVIKPDGPLPDNEESWLESLVVYVHGAEALNHLAFIDNQRLSDRQLYAVEEMGRIYKERGNTPPTLEQSESQDKIRADFHSINIGNSGKINTAIPVSHEEMAHLLNNPKFAKWAGDDLMNCFFQCHSTQEFQTKSVQKLTSACTKGDLLKTQLSHRFGLKFIDMGGSCGE